MLEQDDTKGAFYTSDDRIMIDNSKAIERANARVGTPCPQCREVIIPAGPLAVRCSSCDWYWIYLGEPVKIES